MRSFLFVKILYKIPSETTKLVGAMFYPLGFTWKSGFVDSS